MAEHILKRRWIAPAILAGSLAAAIAGDIAVELPAVGAWLWMVPLGPLSAGQFVHLIAIEVLAGAVGIALIGGPIWLLLHRRGQAGWRMALVAGASIAFVGMVALQASQGLTGGYLTSSENFGSTMEDAIPTPHGWDRILRFGLLAAGLGALAALTTWRVAYRRAPSE